MVGKTLGHYEILDPLGSGGMGDVYRAHDSSLNRDVAIKVLPEDLADDPDRLARLKREAHLLAALNHPNVATIHGFEESEGIRYLVMELVKGESLEQRLAAGRLPVDEALEICRQIAEALEAAHEEGIIHRDLKPANVLITPEGRAKVLDFGLAKTAEAADSSELNISHSPTVTVAGTKTGVILGTAPYMSPEQVRGKPVDKRTDIWAFGCVLYETLATSRAFNRETVADTLAAILEVDPPWDALPNDTPPIVRALLRRCLRKDPRRRLHDIADARIEIEEARDEPAGPMLTSATTHPQAKRGISLRLAIPIGLVAVVAAILVTWYAAAPGPTPSVLHRMWFEPGVEELDLGRTGPTLAISPDGKWVAYGVTGSDGGKVLHLRSLAEGTVTSVPNSEGINHLKPFFTADSREVGFFAGEALWAVTVSGGMPRQLLEIEGRPRGACWTPDGAIIFTPDAYSGLEIYQEGDDKPEVLTVPNEERGELAHYAPEMLPGGEAVLFMARLGGNYDQSDIAVLNLSDDEITYLNIKGAFPRYSRSGHLLFIRDRSIQAVPFDLTNLEVTGSPVEVVKSVHFTPSAFPATFFSVSDTGALLHVPDSRSDYTVVRVDLQGIEQETLPIDPGPWRSLALSPDGGRVLVMEDDLSVYDVYSGMRTQLASGVESSVGSEAVVWTPDGTRVIYLTSIDGVHGLYWTKADGSGQPELLFESSEFPQPLSMSPDKDLIFLISTDTGFAHRELRVDGDRVPTELEASIVSRFSPDGHFITLIRGGQVWVQPYPATADGIQVSTDGGRTNAWGPWGPDGGELFYVWDRQVMVVSIRTQPQLEADLPRHLFTLPESYSGPYGVMDEAQSLVFRKRVGGPIETPVLLHLNWFEELNRLVRTGR